MSIVYIKVIGSEITIWGFLLLYGEKEYLLIIPGFLYCTHKLLRTGRVIEMVLSSYLGQEKTKAPAVTWFAQDHRAGLWQPWNRSLVPFLASLCSCGTVLPLF